MKTVIMMLMITTMIITMIMTIINNNKNNNNKTTTTIITLGFRVQGLGYINNSIIIVVITDFATKQVRFATSSSSHRQSRQPYGYNNQLELLAYVNRSMTTIQDVTIHVLVCVKPARATQRCARLGNLNSNRSSALPKRVIRYIGKNCHHKW